MIEVTGDKKVEENLDAIAKGLTTEMLPAVRNITGIWDASVKQNTPVDLGVLRASETSSVTSSANAVEGVTGSNVKYAGYVEEGTPPHWPPIDALRGWARRHGANVYMVAAGIAKKGTKAHKMFENAFTSSKSRVFQYIEDAVKKLVRNYG